MSDDAINDVAVAEDQRLGYPSHHDWNWMGLGEHYGGWLDAAYPAINRLTRERDELRAENERLRAAGATLLRLVHEGGLAYRSSTAEEALAVFANVAPSTEDDRGTDD